MTAPGFGPSASRRNLSTILLGGTEQSSNTWFTCSDVKRGLDSCQKRPTLVSRETWSTCSKPASVNVFLLYSASFSRTIVDTLRILKICM